MNKYKIDQLDSFRIKRLTAEMLLNISNELAEQNRLTRVDLEMKYKGYARQRLYKSFKDEKGKSFTVPPDVKDKKEYKLEVKAILKEFSDQATDDQPKGEKK